MNRSANVFLAVGLASIVMTGSGCIGPLFTAITVYSPNHQRMVRADQDPDQTTLAAWGVTEQARIDLGTPALSLLTWKVDPPEGKTPRGTILCVHGYRSEMETLLPTARVFSAAGYRVVLVDLPGHGRSTGTRIAYGVLEAHDLTALLDELQRIGWIKGPLGTWGMSMGASTVIRLAANDPRIQAVVAVAPYDNLQDLIAHVSLKSIPVIDWFVDKSDVQRRLVMACLEAGFDPGEADTVKVAQRLTCPLLVVHGRLDAVVPFEQGRRVFEAAAGPKSFVELPLDGHIAIHVFNPAAPQATLDWFNTHLIDHVTQP